MIAITIMITVALVLFVAILLLHERVGILAEFLANSRVLLQEFTQIRMIRDLGDR